MPKHHPVTLVQLAAADGAQDARDGVNYFKTRRYTTRELQRAYDDAYARVMGEPERAGDNVHPDAR